MFQQYNHIHIYTNRWFFEHGNHKDNHRKHKGLIKTRIENIKTCKDSHRKHKGLKDSHRKYKDS